MGASHRVTIELLIFYSRVGQYLVCVDKIKNDVSAIILFSGVQGV